MFCLFRCTFITLENGGKGGGIGYFLTFSNEGDGGVQNGQFFSYVIKVQPLKVLPKVMSKNKLYDLDIKAMLPHERAYTNKLIG